ncbi:MAG: Ig-like domain-containing protein, partial [Muribaculaceae bacterium]|nr:Ig-like domain-containing protein [Muribaculaceae bacterium]
RRLSLPSTLSSLAEMAFAGCPLDSVGYAASTPILADESVFDVDTYLNAVLTTPNATLSSVQSTIPWSRFNHIIASDGSSGFVVNGDEFEYEGILYTIISLEEKTCQTKDGTGDTMLDHHPDYVAGNRVSGNIVIPSKVSFEGEEYTVVKIGDKGFCNQRGLTSVVLPETVKEIGTFAFCGCSGLESINIPDGVTVLQWYLFNGCSSLRSVELPASVTLIREHAFAECAGLTSINIPESVTQMDFAVFMNCTGLTSVSLPASLTSIGNMDFMGCSNLEEISYAASEPVSAEENLFLDETYRQATLSMPNATLAAVQSSVPWNKFLRITASDGSVVPFATEVILSQTAAELKVGETVTLQATVIPENATERTVTWTSDNEEVASVDTDGKVTAISLGEATITATCGPVSATCKVTVVLTPVENVTLSAESLDLVEGETATLTATVAPADATDKTITWTSDNDEVATVSADGEVTAVKAGTATITATTANGMSATCSVTVTAKIIDATDLILSQTTAELKVGETVTLGATVIPENTTDKTVTWTSDNEEVATVDAEGKVTAISLGEATITATCGDVTATCMVTVVPTPVENVTLSNTSLNLTEGETATLTATVAPADATDKTLTWSSSDASVATVSETGEVTAVKAGTANITVESTNGLSATCAVTVTIKGDEFEYEGIIYTVIDSNARTCKTKDGSEEGGNISTGNAYVGGLVIPATAFDGLYDYSVIGIGKYGFYGQDNLSSITLPSGLSFLGDYAFVGCHAITDVTYMADEPVSAQDNIFESDVYRTGSLNMPNAPLAIIMSTMPWQKFMHVEASDGSLIVPQNSDSLEFDGITYIVIDDEADLLRTKDGTADGEASGNVADGNLEIPGTVSTNYRDYTVTEIGDYSFSGNSHLLSVTIPATIEHIGTGAFSDCERLTSLVWLGHTPLQSGVLEEIGNPNLLLYVDSVQYAPEGLDHNIVADGICDNLVLTPGYPFTPLKTFTAKHSEITKEFTQLTPIDGCAGWETLAIPFEPTEITAPDGRALVPFAVFSDIFTQCPFWLYEADTDGEWKEASEVRQSVPYIVSMPDNDSYDDQYRIHGAVTFSTDQETVIAPETTAPYITTWSSGREFRSLWLPLDDEMAADAMGLNVGIDDLTDSDGELLAPGSAFHADVLPIPLEAYVTRIDGRRYMPVRGDQSFIKMIEGDNGLRISVDLGRIILSSDSDRTVDIITIDGVLLRRAYVKAGVGYRIENLTRGIYIVAGRKITVK